MRNLTKNLAFLCLCAFASLSYGWGYGKVPGGFDAKKVEIRPLVESTARGGLPNFYRKLELGRTVKIAYFGGSITAQNGYRVHSAKYFQQQYPKAKVQGIHAAIGGTDSNLGAYRLEHDVLVHKPDLVFVEFAVNDGGARPYNIRRSMEGIVRHIWRSLPKTDIVFVYTIVAGNIKDLQAGKMSSSASVMEDIADYYGIPSIHLGVEIAKLEGEGKLVMKVKREGMTRVSGSELNIKSDSVVNKDGMIPVLANGKIPFAADGVHPYTDTGHALYMSAIERSLPAIKAAGAGKAPLARKELPKPILAECWENAVTVPLDDPRVKLTGDWRKNDRKEPITRPFLNRSDVFFTFKPGAEITFKYRGYAAAAYNLLGPTGGIVEVTVDGKNPVERRMFDPYCTYHRLALLSLGDNQAEKKVHTVKIRVLDKGFDKKSILFDRNKPDFDKHPGKYNGLLFHAGCLFIVGELVD